MTDRTRIKYTAEQKAEMWDRCPRGESLNSIGRAFDRPSSSIFGQLAPSGGIRPPIRQRSRLALTFSEREEISRGIASNLSLPSIVVQLGRSAPTISREIKGNGGYDSYRATSANQAAWDRACRPKQCKLAANLALSRIVAAKLQLNWSPQQIAAWLKKKSPVEEGNQVSHETLYRSLFVPAGGVLKKELLQHLRTQRVRRRSKHSSRKRDERGQISHAVSIRQRPSSVEDRAVPGHWEGDLIAGSKNSYMATLVERHSGYVVLAKVDNKESQTAVSALIKQARKLPKELYKSLTWDRGQELADHQRLSLVTNIEVYFCDPRSP